MIKFKDIFKLAQGYKSQLAQFFGFNILTSIFNVVSIGMVIPFLKVIFRDDDAQLVPAAFSATPSDFLKYLDYEMSLKILEWGKYNALLYFSIGIIIAFFLKNIFLYFSFGLGSP